jgi:hypothetical protein
LICVRYLSSWYVLDIYQVDTTLISINLICVGHLSSWYVLDIYQLDMSWIFINLICLQIYQLDMTPISINLICVRYLSSWYVLDIYQVDTTLISINLICVGYLSSWYVLDIYQLDMCWTFIKLICLGFYQVDMTPISINLICLQIGYSGSQKNPGFLKAFFPDSIFFRDRDRDFKFPRYPSSSIPCFLFSLFIWLSDYLDFLVFLFPPWLLGVPKKSWFPESLFSGFNFFPRSRSRF